MLKVTFQLFEIIRLIWEIEKRTILWQKSAKQGSHASAKCRLLQYFKCSATQCLYEGSKSEVLSSKPENDIWKQNNLLCMDLDYLL